MAYENDDLFSNESSSYQQADQSAGYDGEDYGATDFAADTVVSFESGAASLLKTVGDIYGLSPFGDMDNFASAKGGEWAQQLAAHKSKDLLNQEALRDAKVEAADGTFDKALTSFWETVSNPQLLASFIAEQLPMMLPIGLAGRGAKAGLLAKGFAEGTAFKAGTAAAVGTGAAMQGADAGASAFESLMALPDEMWDVDPKIANATDREAAKADKALALSQNAAIASGIISVGLNMLPGAGILEKTLGGTKLPGKSRLVEGLKGFAGEAISEAGEEGFGAAAANIATQQVDPSQETMQGVGEAAGLGAAGGVFGGAAGVMSKPASESPNTVDLGGSDQNAPQNPAGPTDPNAPRNPADQTASVDPQMAALAEDIVNNPEEVIQSTEPTSPLPDQMSPQTQENPETIDEHLDLMEQEGGAVGDTSTKILDMQEKLGADAIVAADDAAAAELDSIANDVELFDAEDFDAIANDVELFDAEDFDALTVSQDEYDMFKNDHLDQPTTNVAPTETQGYMFGAQPQRQSIANAQAKIDEKLKGTEDVPADIDGGLFSNQQQQVDIEDVKPAMEQKKDEKRAADKPTYKKVATEYTSEKRESEAERIATKLEGMTQKATKALAKDAGIIQSGTKEERNARIIASNDLAKTLAPYKSREQIEAAIDAGDLTYQQFGTWADAVKKPGSKVIKNPQGFEGSQVNIRSVIGWANSKGGLSIELDSKAELDARMQAELDAQELVRQAAARHQEASDLEHKFYTDNRKDIEDSWVNMSVADRKSELSIADPSLTDRQINRNANISEFGSMSGQAWKSVAAKRYAESQPVDRSPKHIRLKEVPIDSETDTLKPAISKGQGLSREAATSMGIDEAHFNERGYQGRPIFPKEGGVSLDDAAESLEQYGYISGVARNAQLSDKVFKTLSGTNVYSVNRGDASMEADRNAYLDEQQYIDELDAEANKAAASPTNNLPEPTDAQIKADNYKKGHITLKGLDIAIENPKGSIRKSKDPANPWERTLKHHYGDIKGTIGADGDAIDVFVGDQVESDKVFVINQVDTNGKFDEHKVMLGFTTESEAVAAYKSNYERGWAVGPVTEMSSSEFKTWTETGDTTKSISTGVSTENQPASATDAAAPTYDTILSDLVTEYATDADMAESAVRGDPEAMDALREQAVEVAQDEGIAAMPAKQSAIAAEAATKEAEVAGAKPLTKQDFGTVRIHHTGIKNGKSVTGTISAQKLWDKTTRKRNIAEKLRGCLT